MALTTPLGAMLYWGGQIRYQGTLIHYEPRRCNAVFVIRHKIGYDGLVDKIYQCMELDRSCFKLKIILRCPCGPSMHCEWPVSNDESLGIIYDLNYNFQGYSAEFYIEKEEIVQVLPANTIGKINVSGTMMSMHQQNLPYIPHPPQYYRPMVSSAMSNADTSMQSVAGHNQFLEAQCGTSCMHHGIDSIPSTSSQVEGVTQESQHVPQEIPHRTDRMRRSRGWGTPGKLGPH